MISKKILIITLIAILMIVGFTGITFSKDVVHLDIHAEKISNTSDIYLITKVFDENDSIVDHNLGKLTIELYDANGCTGVIMEDIPIEHGMNVLRQYHSGESRYVVRYDGGYLYNPTNISGSLKICPSTNLTDDNLTSSF